MHEIAINTNIYPNEKEGDLEYCNGSVGSCIMNEIKAYMERNGFCCERVMQEDYGWGFYVKINNRKIWMDTSCAVGGSEKNPEMDLYYLRCKHEPGFNIFEWFRLDSGRIAEDVAFKILNNWIIEKKFDFE